MIATQVDGGALCTPADPPRVWLQVELQNLKARADLNGRTATIVGPTDNPGRVAAHVEGPDGGTFSFKVENYAIKDEDPDEGKGVPSPAVPDMQSFKLRIDVLGPWAQSLMGDSIRHAYVRYPPRALRKVIITLFADYTSALAIYTFFEAQSGKYRHLTPQDMASKYLDIQIAATFLAHQTRGVARSPDALWTMGMAQMLRGNLPEALQYYAAADAIPEHKWVATTYYRYLKALRAKARPGKDGLIGRWRCLSGVPALLGKAGRETKGKGPAATCGPATCQVGETLYLFGGLKSAAGPFGGSQGFRQYLQCLRETAKEAHIPQGVLYAYHLPTATWKTVPIAADSPKPKPRGFAILLHHEGELLLFGGRLKWAENLGMPFRDFWRFDLARKTWKQIPGNHPDIASPGPAAIHDGGFFVLDAETAGSGSSVLRRFDLKTQEWSTPNRKHRKTTPKLTSEATGWYVCPDLSSRSLRSVPSVSPAAIVTRWIVGACVSSSLSVSPHVHHARSVNRIVVI